jgi:hypothetical protein
MHTLRQNTHEHARTVASTGDPPRGRTGAWPAERSRRNAWPLQVLGPAPHDQLQRGLRITTSTPHTPGNTRVTNQPCTPKLPTVSSPECTLVVRVASWMDEQVHKPPHMAARHSSTACLSQQQQSTTRQQQPPIKQSCVTLPHTSGRFGRQHLIWYNCMPARRNSLPLISLPLIPQSTRYTGGTSGDTQQAHDRSYTHAQACGTTTKTSPPPLCAQRHSCLGLL